MALEQKQVSVAKTKDNHKRNLYSMLGKEEYRIILFMLKNGKALTYVQLKDRAGLKIRSGLFAYYMRNLRDHDLIVKSHEHYVISFKGKRVIKAIEILMSAENLKIENYPSCLKLRVSNYQDDEDLLAEATKRIITEIKKLNEANQTNSSLKKKQ